MENLEIKDIIDVNNIKKLKTEFYNLINSIEESKKNTIANFVFSAPSILIQFFLFGPLLITFLENIESFELYLLIPTFIFALIYYFIFKISMKFNASLNNIKINDIYSFVKKKNLSTNNINKINNFFDGLNEKNKNVLNQILYHFLMEKDEINISYCLLLKKIKALPIEKIREDKDIIFDFIEKEVKQTSQKTEILDYIEKKINELTVSERVDAINNKLKESENINVEKNKNLIKSI